LNFNTIGGFVENKLKKIPKPGEQVELKNLILEIDSVTDKKVKTVKIIKK